jgi:hypothetical protein
MLRFFLTTYIILPHLSMFFNWRSRVFWISINCKNLLRLRWRFHTRNFWLAKSAWWRCTILYCIQTKKHELITITRKNRERPSCTSRHRRCTFTDQFLKDLIQKKTNSNCVHVKHLKYRTSTSSTPSWKESHTSDSKWSWSTSKYLSIL